MKKLLYLFLITSVVFISCSKEDDSPSIIGIWTPTSMTTFMEYTVEMAGVTLASGDTTMTISANDPEWDMDGDVEFTDDGMMYADGDTSMYEFENGTLTVTDSDGEVEENACTVTSTTIEITFTGQDVDEEQGVTTTSDYTTTITAERN